MYIIYRRQKKQVRLSRCLHGNGVWKVCRTDKRGAEAGEASISEAEEQVRFTCNFKSGRINMLLDCIEMRSISTKTLLFDS